MNRLLVALLVFNALFLASTLLLQWRWHLPDAEEAAEFATAEDHGGWHASVRRGSRLWGIAKPPQLSHSAWADAAAAGISNEGVSRDLDAVQHLRDVFQARANLTALQQAQHGQLADTNGGRQEQQGAQMQSAVQDRHQEDEQAAKALGHSEGDVAIGDSLFLSDSIPGDGSSFTMPDPAIVLFCYNRSDYLQQTLDSLVGLEGLQRFALYISQDGKDAGVHAVVRKAQRLLRKRARRFEHWQRPRKSQLGDSQPGHAWLSQHYGWGLDRVFTQRRHSHVIVLEDDMILSPDFLLFFEATAVLLEIDASLWCISSWNDNGRASGFRWDSRRMLRTSYFPGLGWMLRRALWRELRPRWPAQAWDHWMRLPSTAKGRDCIAPEVNRNRNIGELGANMDRNVFLKHLKHMAWHTEKAVYDWGDLSYLVRGNYQAGMQQLMARARLLPSDAFPGRGPSLLTAPPGHVYLVVYRMEEYSSIARILRIFPFPRAHFQHIALLPYRGSFVLLADKRQCPLLPAEHRVWPTSGLQPIRAQRHQSCTSACRAAANDVINWRSRARAQAMDCSRDDFWFINTCEALHAAFPCEAGCAVEMGDDLPNYVQDASLSTFHQCLITQQTPKCAARHPATSRICPCTPRRVEAAGGAGLGATNSDGFDDGSDTTLAGTHASALVSSDHAHFANLVA